MIWRKPAAPTQDEAGSVERVLVVQLGGIVPFVHALAAAQRIRETHIGARITLLTTEATRDLAEKCPYFDTVEADGKPKEAQAITKLIARIRAAKYDVIYDLEGSSRTNNYFQGMRPWPPNWSGPIAGCAYPYLAADRDELHRLDFLSAQLAAAGVGAGEPLMPDLSWVRGALRDPPRLQPDYFGLRGRYVLILPRGTQDTSARRWTGENYVSVAKTLAAHGVTPVILGGEAERQIGAAIAKAEPRAKNLVTRPDLFQTIGLTERAYYAFGDDVDLMHVVAAAGTSCLAFLSSLAEPEKARPRGRGGVVGFTAAVVADIPVEQVERQLRNAGVYGLAQTA
jgi:ADP-heptose:LPS heptosyltransferase